jgi:hypothetical protein
MARHELMQDSHGELTKEGKEVEGGGEKGGGGMTGVQLGRSRGHHGGSRRGARLLLHAEPEFCSWVLCLLCCVVREGEEEMEEKEKKRKGRKRKKI